jgi:hypothetical protein
MTVQSIPPPLPTFTAKSAQVKEHSPKGAQRLTSEDIYYPLGIAAFTGAIATWCGYDAKKLMKTQLEQGLTKQCVKKNNKNFRITNRLKKQFGLASVFFAYIGAENWWNSGGDKQVKDFFSRK